MIQIFTDTSANLPAAYIQKYSLRVIPLTYFVDGVEAHQDPAVDFDGKAYYDAMRSGTPGARSDSPSWSITSMPGPSPASSTTIRLYE